MLANQKKSYFIPWITLCLLLISQPAYSSSNLVPWKTYLFVVMAIAALVGGFMSWRNPKTESFMGRFLLAGVYFWVLTFAQFIILALIFQLTK